MDIEVKVPIGKCGDWEVKEFEVSKRDASIFNVRAMLHPGRREIGAGQYKKLTRNGRVIMSNPPAEVNDHRHFINKARGDILITGLGLGVVVEGLLKKEEVKSITVIENSKEVVELVAPTFESDSRVKIICADAFEWKPPRGMKYDFAWHDIWDDICSDNLEGMKKLHGKYGRYAKWQGSWARVLCERYARSGY